MSNRAAHPELWNLDAAAFKAWAVIVWAGGVPVLERFIPPSSTPGAGRQGTYVPAPTSNGSGMPTGSAGVATIARQSAGDFLLTLQDRYNRLLQVNATWLNAAGLPTIDKIGVKSGSSAFLGGNQVEFCTIKKTATAGTSAVTGTAAGQVFTGTPGTVPAETFTGTPTTLSLAGQGGAVVIPDTGTVGYTPAGSNETAAFTPAGTNAPSAITATAAAQTITLADTKTDPVDGDTLLLALEFSNSTVPQ